uniref:Transcription factor CBF/NF-Y/archaeal histone domain-containing protein n=1 Tax=Aegilops tauschii subsp. strangulata TaxID=200361 RepID=A0A453S9R9_AEGTS
RPALPAPQQRAVDGFWRERQEEMEATVDFNDRILPMARLKRLIRAEEDGMMIAADTPAYLAKLCELFVQELAVRAWACAQSHRRRIILESDIAEAAAYTESYDFLATVLLEHQREARLAGRATPTTVPVSAARARLITRKRHMPDPNPRPAGPAGAVALPTVHPAAYYLCAYPVTNDVEAFAVGNTDPDVIPPEIVVGDVAIPPDIIEGNVADGNGDGGQQQQQSENLGGNGESVVVPQSNDVQEDGADGMFLEEILMDEDLMFPDAELFPLVGAAPGPEDFIVDQDVLDDVFANPSSSASSD